MLNSLHVKNLALIEETEVNFGKQLNILTGETGAGKSIIIGSINLALGAKADKDMIRTGAESALVELVFSLDQEQQINKLREMDIDIEEDQLIISRKISQTKSVCRVNGETVTAKQLQEIAAVLIDVYGQHEHQTLTNSKKQFAILDDYASQELEPIKEKLVALAGKYKELCREWEESDRDDSVRHKEIALAEFEIKEISEANLTVGEDEILEQQYRKMVNSRKIMENVSLAHQLLATSESESISELTGRAHRSLKQVESYDEKISQFALQLSEIESLVYDVSRELADYEDGLEFDPEEFSQTEQRLNEINRLKEKYGSTIEEILAYYEKQELQLEKWKNYDVYLEQLEKKIQAVKQELLLYCGKASEIRKTAAGELAQRMSEALVDLNFLDVKFEIKVTPDEEKLGATGYDSIEFLISTNPGEPLKPLSHVASGGELSRIMLGLKTVMASQDETGTLIFDEIDAGISGKTAWQVSKKLAVLGGRHQVLCITHLPQIAAMADTHFAIEKKITENHTSTQIAQLSEEESIHELARLLGGDLLTEAAISNAIEMKELAANTKQY